MLLSMDKLVQDMASPSSRWSQLLIDALESGDVKDESLRKSTALAVELVKVFQ